MPGMMSELLGHEPSDDRPRQGTALCLSGGGYRAMVFHAGTAREDRVIVAAGGRVLNVTATGKSVTEAQARAYAAVDRLDFPTGFCRRDIGWREIARERAGEA